MTNPNTFRTATFAVTRNTMRDPGWVAYVCAHIHVSWAHFQCVNDDDIVAYECACKAGIIFG